MKLNNQTKVQLIAYERSLQNPANFNINDLNQLLDDDFYEIGQSGTVWFKKELTNYFERRVTDYQVEMLEEQFKIVSQTVILLTYKLKKTDMLNNRISYSLRSSLWRNQGGRWVMIFHQGTTVSPPKKM